MNTVQDIFNKFYPDYLEKYTPNCQQAKAAKDIMNCRTSALGGHAYKCDKCGNTVVRYNSCRNRHCSLCQGINKEIWVDKRRADVLDAPYFHVIFTIPKQLQLLVYQNQKLLYKLMYMATSQTISELSWNPKHLGAQVGFLSMIHTWGQNLHYHPHIHMVIMAGGLTKLNQWHSTSKKFFIPVEKLSKKFRGKFMYYLKQYYKDNQLKFYGDLQKYKDPNKFQKLVDECYELDWYTYVQETFSGPLAVIKYLGMYTHRIAISNTRIVSINNTTVTFTVKDYKNNGKKKTITMEGVEFIRRFLMHILPKGFVKIRYYGIISCRNKNTKLVLCKKLIFSSIYKPLFEGLTTFEILCILLGRDVTLCPVCKKSKLQQVSTFYHGASP